MKQMILKLCLGICCVVFVVSLVKVISIQLQLSNDTHQFNELETMYYEAEQTNDTQESRLAQLKKVNDDVVGWLCVDGTGIDYPLMLTKDDPQFYIHKDFNQNESASGVPFIGENCDLGSDNILIYGHNMKNGTMFAPLLNYNDKSYWSDHPLVTIDTLDGKRTYEIIAAFYGKAYTSEDTDVFRYYNYINFGDEASFDEYIAQINEARLYDTGVAVRYGKQLITLSTCEYSVEDGRFVVVAQQMD